MRPRTAMVLAVVAGSLAVAIVAVDLTWNLTVRVEVDEGGTWTTIASDDGEGFYGRGLYDEPGRGCVSGHLRVVVDNDRPFGKTVEVVVTLTNATNAREVLVDETWELGAFDSRSADFMVTAAPAPSGSSRDPFAFGGEIVVEAGGRFISVCREVAA